MKGFINILIVLLLFIPLSLTTIEKARLDKAKYNTEIIAARLAYYYDDIVWDLEKIIGMNSTYYKMTGEDNFQLIIEDSYRVEDYRSEISSYENEVIKYLTFLGIGYSVSFDGLKNNDYSNVYLATRSGNKNSYYKRYLSSFGNTSLIKINKDEVGTPTSYVFDMYVRKKIPFVSDSFSATSNSTNGTLVKINLCYPYLAQTECREYTTRLDPGGSASYSARFLLDVCDKDVNVTITLGGYSSSNDEVYVYVPSDLTIDTNITINGTTNTSNYKFTQLFLGKDGFYNNYLVLWSGNILKGDYKRIILDEG